jgi:hypothetical protein
MLETHRDGWNSYMKRDFQKARVFFNLVDAIQRELGPRTKVCYMCQNSMWTFCLNMCSDQAPLIGACLLDANTPSPPLLICIIIVVIIIR